MSSLQAAEAARDKMVNVLRDRGNVSAVGIAKIGAEYVVRVRTSGDGGEGIPSEIDGVPVSSRRSGSATAHGAV